jgi:predicted component of type VI protein secretion system
LRFEPRLREVQVALIEPNDLRERKIQIRVQARLHVAPAPELPFDTVLELTTDRFSIPSSTP